MEKSLKKKAIFTEAELFREKWQNEIFTGSRLIELFVLCFD